MPHDIFREQISTRLQRLYETSPATTVILVPSVRDIISRHMAFPQAMFDRDTLGLPKVSPVHLSSGWADDKANKTITQPMYIRN
jgi:hypothetical protein